MPVMRDVVLVTIDATQFEVTGAPLTAELVGRALLDLPSGVHAIRVDRQPAGLMISMDGRLSEALALLRECESAGIADYDYNACPICGVGWMKGEDCQPHAPDCRLAAAIKGISGIRWVVSRMAAISRVDVLRERADGVIRIRSLDLTLVGPPGSARVPVDAGVVVPEVSGPRDLSEVRWRVVLEEVPAENAGMR